MSEWREIWAQASRAKDHYLHSNDFSLLDLLLKQHPGDGMVYYTVGEALEQKGKYNDAKIYYTNALSLFPMPRWQQNAKNGIERCNRRIKNDVKDTVCKDEIPRDENGNEVIF